MKRFEKDEILTILRSLSNGGMDVMIPDTEVQYYPDGVRCGIPTELSPYNWDVVTLPKQMLGNRPTVVVKAVGDSMIGADIHPGDKLLVELTSEVKDGDVVIATIDGESTAKTFFTYKDGSKWLLPQNKAYKPIPLTGDHIVQIYGKVLSVTQELPRTSYNDCVKILHDYEALGQESLSDEKVKEAVVNIMPMLKNSRQWYSIFRVLVDKEFYRITDLDMFQRDVERWCPDARYKVNAYDLAKMAVLSFRKSVGQWNSVDAPVKGKYFIEYLMLARSFVQVLRASGRNGTVPSGMPREKR